MIGQFLILPLVVLMAGGDVIMPGEVDRRFDAAYNALAAAEVAATGEIAARDRQIAELTVDMATQAGVIQQQANSIADLEAALAACEAQLAECLAQQEAEEAPIALIMGTWMCKADQAHAIDAGWTLAATSYRINLDPNGDGVIDPDALRADIEKKIPDPDAGGWGILDLEAGYDDADRIEAIELARSARPGVQWGYWGYPLVNRMVYDPRYGKKLSIHIASAEAIDAAKQAAIDEHAALWPHVDFILPGVYDEAVNAVYGEGWGRWQRALVKARIEAAIAIADGRPVIACLSHTAQKEPYGTALGTDEIDLDQITPALGLGVDGVAWWHWQYPEYATGTEQDVADFVMCRLIEALKGE